MIASGPAVVLLFAGLRTLSIAICIRVAFMCVSFYQSPVSCGVVRPARSTLEKLRLARTKDTINRNYIHSAFLMRACDRQWLHSMEQFNDLLRSVGLTEDRQLSRVEELLAIDILIQPELEASLVKEATSTSCEVWLKEVIHLISVVCCKRDLADRTGDGCIYQCLCGSHM